LRELVEAVDALRTSPALAARLAGNAQRLLYRRYTWERNAAQVLAMIDRIHPRRRSTTKRHVNG
jgi:hypothetical protein